jgi:hypothetical protein
MAFGVWMRVSIGDAALNGLAAHSQLRLAYVLI